MMKIAIKICEYDSSFEDVATKFFEHFVYISESLNKSDDWIGAWDEEEGFYYDVLRLPGKKFIRLKIHSLVGLSPLYAVSLIPKETLKDIPGFTKRLKWFVNNRVDKSKFLAIQDYKEGEDILFSLIPKDRMIKLMRLLTKANFWHQEGFGLCRNATHRNTASTLKVDNIVSITSLVNQLQRCLVVIPIGVAQFGCPSTICSLTPCVNTICTMVIP